MIRDLIQQAPPVAELSNDGLVDQIGQTLLRMSKADMWDAIRECVANEVRLRRRDITRAAESSDGTPADPDKPRRDLLSESFFVSPERGYVRWGEATIDDHLTRAAYLRNMAGGLIGTAEKHEATAKLLSESDAKCLYDLGQVAA